MTECERIVDSGLIDSSFLSEEIRCDFVVKQDMKKSWAIMIDLLNELDRVCREHDLKYFLIFGTLLGAVRHKGFIPWDDDVDVVMPRESYEKLKELKGEFKDPYFLQLPLQDDGFYYTSARLRNSNTSAMDYPFLYQNFNMGIFIDINVLDNYDVSLGSSKFDRVSELIVRNSTHMKREHLFLSERDQKRVDSICNDTPEEIFAEIELLQKKDNSKNCERVWISSCVTYGFQKNIFFMEDFENSMYMEFEGLLFPVPIGYKRVLTTIYGDYSKLPPIEKRGVWHHNLRLNPDVPYKESLMSIFPNGKAGKINW